MNIKIACAGKMKDRYWTDAAADYEKRISRFASVEIAEVADERIPENASPAEERIATEREGERMLARIMPQEYVIALAINGKSRSSEEFAAHLDALQTAGHSRITFVIGGSLGLSDAVLKRADERLSFSPMTFPHRLARIMLLEQIYRSFKIIRGESYHK